MHAAAVLETTRPGITMPLWCVFVRAGMCVFVLQAQSAGQDKYAFKRLIFHFRNWRRQNGSILSWRTQHKERRGGNKNIKEGKRSLWRRLCVQTHAERKEAQSRAFVVYEQSQRSTKLNIWNTNPALLIRAFCSQAAKSKYLMKADKSMSEEWTKVTSGTFQRKGELTSSSSSIRHISLKAGEPHLN